MYYLDAEKGQGDIILKEMMEAHPATTKERLNKKKKKKNYHKSETDLCYISVGLNIE